MFDKLTFARFRFITRVETPMRLPAYKGGTLRGGFGYALKRTICVYGRANCNDCMLKEKCVYSYIFETSPPEDSKFLRNFSDIPHPFIIEPPLDGRTIYNPDDQLIFDVILIGKAIELLPYMIISFEKLGEVGLGRDRGQFMILSVKSGEIEVYNGEEKRLSTEFHINKASGFVKKLTDHQISLNFLTPARMKYNEKLTDQPDFHILIRSLLARISSLAYFHCGITPDFDPKEILSAAETVSVEGNNTYWQDWQRYSTRKQYEMKLGGIMGQVTYVGEIEHFIPLLMLGEYIHVGKGTSFGLGKYVLANEGSIHE